ncbi:dual OB domain-containing protein [Pseudidiomarina sp.]|uniref:dual OB domain-containing protein n=1 Tax=Pseudidiomarina sp. TaxID=2081707 RepID=UPI003A98043A
MYKKFVCLANSRKVSGRCIAGKELINGVYENWIRPVSERNSHEISEVDRRYQDGSTAQIFDIVGLKLKSKSAHPAQKENYTIDDGYYWSKEGRYTDSLDFLLDDPDSLWQSDYSSYNGTNDRIPTTAITAEGSSLYFIQPHNLEIVVRIEGAEFGNGKKKVRAAFSYNGDHYLISVTDPEIERIYLAQGEGRYKLNGQYFMTVSLGDAWEGYYYKLAAGVFEAKQ